MGITCSCFMALFTFIIASIAYYHGLPPINKANHIKYFKSQSYRAKLVYAMRSFMNYIIRDIYKYNKLPFYLEIFLPIINVLGLDIFGGALRPTSNNWDKLFDSFEILFRKAMEVDMKRRPLSQERHMYFNPTDEKWDEIVRSSSWMFRKIDINTFIQDHSAVQNTLSQIDRFRNRRFVAHKKLPYNIKVAFDDAQNPFIKRKSENYYKHANIAKPILYEKINDIQKRKEKEFPLIIDYWMREFEIDTKNIKEIIISYQEFIKYDMFGLENAWRFYYQYHYNPRPPIDINLNRNIIRF